MNVLIIGGSNFIGWRLIESLQKKNCRITVINRGNRKKEYPTDVTHVILNRNNYEGMKTFVNDKYFDVVFDMCAFNGNDMSFTTDLFENKIGKYVFISTAATYLEPEILPIKEDYKQGVHPLWGKYGGDKLECEKILLDAYKKNGFPVVIVRPSYVYGIGNSIDRETFLFDRITKGRTILLPGDGDSVIQLGEVTDLCEALILIGASDKGVGESYNISGNEYTTLKGLVSIVASIMKMKYNTININPLMYGMTDRDIFPFENSTYFTSCEKFSKEFNWEPKISINDGISHAYEHWLHSNNRIVTKYEKEDIVLADLLSKGFLNHNEK